MSGIDYDKVAEVEEDLCEKLKQLVTAEIAAARLNDEEDNFLRLRLNEQYRFWK